MKTHFGLLMFGALLLGSAVPANASLTPDTTATVSPSGTLTGYWGCTHFPTGGTVCEDDGYGPLEPRPKKK